MSEARTVLVTGAGGFIGGRIVEVMPALDSGSIRAGLRRWSSGARIGRFPIDMVQCDVRDAGQVEAALRGVTHVVHCAVGDHESTVTGTRVLLDEAAKADVRRVVHLSTIAVYGSVEGDVDETHPTTPTGSQYGDSKIEAERVCQEYAARGLPVTILRPTLVHGPFSATWTIAYAQRLQQRPWLIPEATAQGTCNLVYVDDLVGAVLAALDTDTAPGEAFNVNGPERVNWNEYFHALNGAMGLPPLVTASRGHARVKARLVMPFRQSAKFLLKHFESQVMAAYQRSQIARSVMKRAERLIRNTPVPAEFTEYGKRTWYTTEKAQRVLGYRPRFPLSVALPLTAGWLRHHGFVEDARGG